MTLASQPPSLIRRRVELVLVWAVWLACTALLSLHAWRYATVTPFVDDLVTTQVYAPGVGLSWPWLWGVHNDHRVPLPKLVHAAVIYATRDYRAGSYVIVALAAACAAGFLVAARWIRGRTAWSDAFFPLAWLHWAHGENVLSSFQLCFLIPLSIATGMFLCVLRIERVASTRAIVLVSCCTLALPLCGTNGVVQAPPFVLWLAWVARSQWRHAEPAARRAARAAIGGIAGIVALCAVYFVDYQRLPGPGHPPFADFAVTSAQALSQGLGAPAYASWPWASVLIVVACALAAWFTLRHLLRAPPDLVRTGGIAALFAAALLVPLSIGWGRALDGGAPGFTNRYGHLSVLALSLGYCCWQAFAPPRWRFVVPFAACLAWAAAYPANYRAGADFGERRVLAHQRLEQNFARGLSNQDLADRSWADFYYSSASFAQTLDWMESARMGLFAHPVLARGPARYPMLRARPTRTRFPSEPSAREIEGRPILLVPSGSALEFELEPGARAARATFGIHPAVVERGIPARARYSIQLRTEGRPPVQLYERVLDPLARSEDRGFQDAWVTMPFPASGSLVLYVQHEPGAPASLFAFWTDVRLIAPPAEDFRALCNQPTRASHDPPLSATELDGRPILQAPSGSELAWSTDGSQRHARFRFGVDPTAIEGGLDTRATFTLEHRTWSGARRELFRRALDPRSRPSDAGSQQVELTLEPLADGELVLRVVHEPGASETAFAYWADVLVL